MAICRRPAAGQAPARDFALAVVIWQAAERDPEVVLALEPAYDLAAELVPALAT
jgi:hypothetical protein